MSMESSSDDLVAGVVKVASLYLSPNVVLSLSLALTICSYIKRRIASAKKRRKKGKGGRITRYSSLFSLLFEVVKLLDWPLELGNLVERSHLLFELDKFVALLVKHLIPKPLNASIFSFQGSNSCFSEDMCLLLVKNHLLLV